MLFSAVLNYKTARHFAPSKQPKCFLAFLHVLCGFNLLSLRKTYSSNHYLLIKVFLRSLKLLNLKVVFGFADFEFIHTILDFAV